MFFFADAILGTTILPVRMGIATSRPCAGDSTET
jgi:hypothetical protein